MANICSINIFIPLTKVPDDTEREQLTALYEAEQKWRQASEKNKSLLFGKSRERFLAAQPGVPTREYQGQYYEFDEEVKKGQKKIGEKHVYQEPTIGAHYVVEDEQIMVYPYGFGRGYGLLFDPENGISFNASQFINDIFSQNPHATIAMGWDFKYDFPWWALVGFAGGKKICDEAALDTPEGKSREFYEQWNKEYPDLNHPYLVWEAPVPQVIKNLEYCIEMLENFPCHGPAWETVWVWEELNNLAAIYRWIKQINSVCPGSLATLDYGEVAASMMRFEEARKSNEPNETMELFRGQGKDINALSKGIMSTNEFRKKYAANLKNEPHKKGYTPISQRSPFDSTAHERISSLDYAEIYSKAWEEFERTEKTKKRNEVSVGEIQF